MIDRAELRKELEEKFLGFIPDKSDLEKLEDKIELSEPVIKDLKIYVNHAYGVHQAMLEWLLEEKERTLARAEISLEILTKKYEKFNN
jgi:hypothetical protein